MLTERFKDSKLDRRNKILFVKIIYRRRIVGDKLPLLSVNLSRTIGIAMTEQPKTTEETE